MNHVVTSVTYSPPSDHGSVTTYCTECVKLRAKIERLRESLDDIASGELGLNICIKVAKKALEQIDSIGHGGKE